MPRFDGTGPLGYGAGTGWGMGPCGGGLRRGRGYGYGYGYGRRFYPGYGYGYGYGYGRRFYTKEEESEVLKDEAKDLEEELKAVKGRLTELNKK